VGEDVLRVTVTAEALQETPDRRQCGEKAEEARVVRVALHGVLPVVGVQAEEELDVLVLLAIRQVLKLHRMDITYTGRIGERAIHVTEEKVPKLDRVEASQQ